MRLIYNVKIFINRTFLLLIFYWVMGIWLTFQVFHILATLFQVQSRLPAWLKTSLSFFESHNLLFRDPGTVSSVLLVTLLWLFFPTGRNFLLFVFKKYGTYWV